MAAAVAEDMVFNHTGGEEPMIFGISIDLAPQNWVKIRNFGFLGVVLKLSFSAVG